MLRFSLFKRDIMKQIPIQKFQCIFESKSSKKCTHVKSNPKFYSANMYSMDEIGGSEYTPYSTRANVDDRT